MDSASIVQLVHPPLSGYSPNVRWYWLVVGPLWWVGCTTSIDDVEKQPGSGGAAGASAGGASGGITSGGSGGTGSGGTGSSGATGGSDASTGGVGAQGGSGAASGGVAGATEDAGGIGALGGNGSIDIYASVADCIDTSNPNPDQCESVMGKYQMVVDLQNSAMIGQSGSGGGPPTAVFVRFDLGPYLAAKTIVSAQYEMTITDYTNSGSTSSGEVFEVSTFTRPDLFTAAPTKQGGVIGQNKGTVATLETVSWQLPLTTPAGKEALCLGVFPTNIDGAYYYNTLGTTPPRLRIDYE
jgi:hypothetical protein